MGRFLSEACVVETATMRPQRGDGRLDLARIWWELFSQLLLPWIFLHDSEDDA